MRVPTLLLFLFVSVFISTSASGQDRVGKDKLILGTGTSVNKVFEGDIGLGSANPKIRFNPTTPNIEFANDGVNYTPLGAGFDGGLLTKDYVLATDLTKDTFVQVFDDAGTAKIKNVIEGFAKVQLEETTFPLSGSFYSSMVYSGIKDRFILFSKSSVDNFIHAQVIDYNSGSPVLVGDNQLIVTDNPLTMCVVHNRHNNNFTMFYKLTGNDTNMQVKLFSLQGTIVSQEDSGSLPAVSVINQNIQPKCIYNEVRKAAYVSYVSTTVTKGGFLVGVESANNTLSIGTQTNIEPSATSIAGLDLQYSKIYDSILLGFTFGGAAPLNEYYLYRTPNISTNTFLDSTTGTQKSSVGISFSEDSINGGILSLVDDALLTKIYHRAIDVSLDTVVLGSITEIAGAPSADVSISNNLVSGFNKQAEQSYVLATIIDNIGFTTEIYRTTGTATLSTSTVSAWTLRAIDHWGSGFIRYSKNEFVQTVGCFIGSVASTMNCDFFGGNIEANTTNDVGLFISSTRLAGTTGTVLLYGGVTNQVTGTIGAPVYIDFDSGLLTETPSIDSQILGEFLDATTFQLRTKKLERDEVSLTNVLLDDYHLILRDTIGGTVPVAFTKLNVITKIGTNNAITDYDLAGDVWTSSFEGWIQVSLFVTGSSQTSAIALRVSKNDANADFSLAEVALTNGDYGQASFISGLVKVSVGDTLIFGTINTGTGTIFVINAEYSTINLVRVK